MKSSSNSSETPQKMNLIRIDKNIAKQGIDFLSTYGSDGQLIFDTTLYLANTFQNNLFSFGEFDIYDFSKKLGYNVSNLKRTVPDHMLFDPVKQKDEDPELNFTSVIENALYKATATTLTFSNKVIDYTSGTKSKTISSYQIIQHLSKHVSLKRKDIFTYSFEVSDTFASHISQFFTLTDLDRMKDLRKHKVVFLYFFLKILSDALRKNSITEGKSLFDTLCKKSGITINSNNPRKAKQMLKSKLDKLKELEVLNFNYQFVRVHGRFKYGVNLIFPDNANYHEIEEKEIANKHLMEAVEDLTRRNIVKHYRKLFQNQGRLNKKKFLNWIKSTEKKDLVKIYIETISAVKKISFQESKTRYSRTAERYITELCKNGTH